MKKVIFAVLVIVATLAMLYFTGILRELRQSFFSDYEQQTPPTKVFYFTADAVTEDPRSDALLSEAARQFVPLSVLRAGDVSAVLFSDTNVVMIQTLEHRVRIDASGQVKVDGESVSNTVERKMFGDELYLSAADLNAFEAGRSIGLRVRHGEGRSMYVTHERISYPRGAAPLETRLFPTAAWVVESEKPSGGLFDFGEQIPYYGESSGEGYLYPDESDSAFVRYFGANGVYGVARQEKFVAAERTTAAIPTAHRIDYAARGPHVLTWEGVYGQNPDTAEIPEMPGLTAISPTWYTLNGSLGEMTDMVSTEYIEWARGRKYEIWPLIKNEFEDIQSTSRFLASQSAQETLIRKLVDEAVKHGFNGINVDFEHVYLSDRDALTHFINMLAFDLRKWGIMISVDVTVTGGAENWSLCYDHRALGIIADYLIIMAYDEYYAASPTPGPVASFGWVKHHMEILAQMVEPQKLVLGLPFYTRLWVETTNPENPTRTSLRSSAISMIEQEELLGVGDYEVKWDEASGLYLATAAEGNELYKMWAENAETLTLKMTLVDALGLGGVAGWRRAYEVPAVWDAIKTIHK